MCELCMDGLDLIPRFSSSPFLPFITGYFRPVNFPMQLLLHVPLHYSDCSTVSVCIIIMVNDMK